MASSAANKKNKKVKRKAVSLQDFLGVNGSETKPGVVQVTKAIATSWADEPEEDDDRPLQTFSLPTAPRSSRALDDVPELPPYIAHLSNLPFDVEDEDIYDLFDELEVEKLRVPREDGGERSRGFGYIEFKKRNDLIAALTMPDPHIRNRRLRIDISTEADQKRGGRGRYDGDSSNWRHNEGGSSRDDENGSGRRNYTSFGATRDWSSNADEEGGNWRDSLKAKSSPPPVRRSNYGDRDGGDRGGGYDRGDRDRGDRGSDRPLTRSNITESDRPLTRSNITENDRPLTRSNISENDRPMTRSNIDNDAVVAERPKLNLQKRTLPLPEIIVAVDVDAKETETEEPPKRAEPKSVPAADIFGEAKPVDTAARDRAVEERLERERLAIVEAAEKARLEREAAKAEAAAAAAAAENVVDSVELNGDVEKVVEAPVVNSWRRKDDAPTNGNEEAPRTQSPARRRFSPDRRGGSRRTDDRWNNERDYNRRGDNQREITRGENNNRDHSRGRNDNLTRGTRGGDDRPLRRNENRTFESSGDEKAPAKKEPAEPRLPKYQPPPTNPKLETTNKFDFLDDEGSD